MTEETVQHSDASALDAPVEAAPQPDSAASVDVVDFTQVRERVRMTVESGHAQQALGLLEQLSRWPDTTRQLEDNIWLHRNVAELNLSLGQTEQALQAYERAYELDPSEIVVVQPYAVLLYEQGQVDQCLRVLQSLLLGHKHELSPSDLVGVYHRLGGCYEANQEHVRARHAYEKALEYNQTDEHALAGLLRVAAHSKNPQDIIKIRQRVIRQAPDATTRAAATIALGDDWAQRFNDPLRALDAYEAALAEDPANEQALVRIAQLARQERDWRRVSRAYFTLSKLNTSSPKDEADWLIKASDIARDELWEPEKALAGYRRAVSLDPSRLDAFNVITAIMVDDNDWPGLKEAYVNIITAHLQKPDPDPELISTLCQKLGDLCENQLGETDDAIKAYHQATVFLPQNVELHERVATLAETHKDAEFLDSALEHLRAIQTIAPQTPGILERIARVHLRKKDVERAFCTFRVLSYKGAPLDDKAQDFVSRFKEHIYRSPKRPLSLEVLKNYVFSEHMDRRVSSVFGIIKPGLAEWAGESRSKHNLGRRDRVKIEEPLAFNNIYRSIGGLLAYQTLPELWLKPTQNGLVNGALYPEGMIVGSDLTSDATERAIAFAVAKQLFLFMGPFYMAVIRPHELNVFFRIALAFANNQNLQGADDVMKVLRKKLKPESKQQLQRVAQEIAAQDKDPDIALWTEAVEDSANRVGFIFCDDLQACEAYLRQEPQRISQRSVEERMESLTQYALSEKYVELRELLGIQVKTT